jgi:hypothetical protein
MPKSIHGWIRRVWFDGKALNHRQGLKRNHDSVTAAAATDAGGGGKVPA